MTLSAASEKTRIGTTFKKMRLDKHFTIKEVAAEEVSRSFIYKFEQGEYDISVSKLLFLLKRIGVSFDELMMTANHGSHDQDNFFASLFLAIESHDQKKLGDLVQLNDHGSSLTQRLVASLASLFLTTDDEKSRQNKASFIFNYLLSVQTWTRFELQAFNYVIPFMTSDQQLLLFPKSRDCVLNYKNSYDDLYLYYFGYIAVDIVHTLLKKNKIAASHTVISAVQEVQQVTSNERLTVSSNFIQALVHFYEDASAQSVGPVLNTLASVKEINDKYARQLETIWNYHLKHLNLSD